MVRVAADGFAPANLTLVTRAGEPLPPLRFVMEPLTAVLRVRSDPPDAQVRVDGEEVGTTPIESLTLTPGRHEVRLERHGYLATSQTVEVSLRLARRPETGAGPAPYHEVRRGDLIPLASADEQPTRLKGDAPSYPDEARRHGFQGTVTVDVLVDENGHVQDPHIRESAGEVLDNAVLETVRGWLYLPARKNGVDVKVRIQVKTTFKNS
jgi:TonB family protein